MIGGFVYNDEDCAYIWAENQEWDDKTIEQLKKEYNIFYERGSCIAVMLDGFSKQSGGMIVFGIEDDGAIYFNKDELQCFKHTFHSGLLPVVLKELNDVCEYMKARGYKCEKR